MVIPASNEPNVEPPEADPELSLSVPSGEPEPAKQREAIEGELLLPNADAVSTSDSAQSSRALSVANARGFRRQMVRWRRQLTLINEFEPTLGGQLLGAAVVRRRPVQPCRR